LENFVRSSIVEQNSKTVLNYTETFK